MNFPLPEKPKLILVLGRICGPDGDVAVRLALDTGATYSVIDSEILALAGYDPVACGDRVRISTASGIEFCPRVVLSKFECLDRQVLDFPVLGHALPEGTAVDGLLGLDFLHGTRLTLDFKSGILSLTL